MFYIWNCLLINDPDTSQSLYLFQTLGAAILSYIIWNPIHQIVKYITTRFSVALLIEHLSQSYNVKSAIGHVLIIPFAQIHLNNRIIVVCISINTLSLTIFLYLPCNVSSYLLLWIQMLVSRLVAIQTLTILFFKYITSQQNRSKVCHSLKNINICHSIFLCELLEFCFNTHIPVNQSEFNIYQYYSYECRRVFATWWHKYTFIVGTQSIKS